MTFSHPGDAIQSIIDAFKSAMQLTGIEPPDTFNANGDIHRFHVTGDKIGTKNGWYVLHADYPPSGAFGCHKRQISEKFARSIHPNRTAEGIKQTDRADHIEKLVQREQKKQKAIATWERATQATDKCQYLKSKSIRCHGLRYSRKYNALLVPVMDSDGVIHGVQRIFPDGSKRFALGTDKYGHFYQIGNLQHGTILIAEGYATAATLLEVSGHAVIVAFDSGNLLPVAQAIRSKMPDCLIVLCADDDWSAGDNPGLTAAIKAAVSVSGLLSVPVFRKSRDKEDTDFNDLHRLEGADAVKSCLQAVGVFL